MVGVKIFSIQALAKDGHHILSGIIPGAYLTRGGLNFKAPGHRSHDMDCECPACDGAGRHVHEDDHEVFIILQGKACIEVNGESHPLAVGDVVVCEPGEDHHLISDDEDPCVNIYLHAGSQPHPKQVSVSSLKSQ
jgi:mannose-6-phosphate isomerase-like protein (cupin superfamily)